MVDDGSTDATVACLRPLRELRIVRQDHTGMPGQARNAGARVARGEYLAFLDSDDLWLPHKLAVQVAAAVAAGDAINHTRERWLRGARLVSQRGQHHRRSGDLFADSLRKCIIGPSTVLLRRAAFEEAGGFREDLEIAEGLRVVAAPHGAPSGRLRGPGIGNQARRPRRPALRALRAYRTVPPARAAAICWSGATGNTSRPPSGRRPRPSWRARRASTPPAAASAGAPPRRTATPPWRSAGAHRRRPHPLRLAREPRALTAGNRLGNPERDENMAQDRAGGGGRAVDRNPPEPRRRRARRTPAAAVAGRPADRALRGVSGRLLRRGHEHPRTAFRRRRAARVRAAGTVRGGQQRPADRGRSGRRCCCWRRSAFPSW